MPDFVVVDRLVKRYGRRIAVRGVSFAIEEGEVIGLLGPNGSGKSTILRVLAGYLPPSAGSVHIAGVDVAADLLAARARVGYVPEDAPRGYRQRVAIAQALINDPPVLILDEPTNALDAYQVIAVRALIRSLSGRRTVLVASHVLTEIERVASRIMILVDGRLLTTDAMREAGAALRFRLRIAGPEPAVLATLRRVPGVIDAAPADAAESYLVGVTPGRVMAAALAQAIVEQGFALSELAEVKPGLESVFLDLTRRASAMAANAA